MRGFEPVFLGPGVLAGFTSRPGGVSLAPYDSLNLGAAQGDDPTAVAENRARLDRFVGTRVRFARQIHSGDARWLAGAPQGSAAPACDALAADGGALGVLTADCLPLLLADYAARVIGVAHAGRRGLLGGVIEATVALMADHGASRAAIVAAIGPGVCAACYPVASEMAEEAEARYPGAGSTAASGQPSIDLRTGARIALARAGVERVTDITRCTAEDAELYSHRRDGAATGRQAGVVAMPARME